MSRDPILHAKKADLRYLTDTSEGFHRKRHPQKHDRFIYLDQKGQIITDENQLERIYNLVIPPAWQKVWISPYKNSHMQATGFDDKGRKQYIYHSEWTKLCQQDKFSKMVDFATALPKIRNRVRYDLNRKELDYKRVIATIVWLLENTLIRVGNDEYAKANNSFGLTTLRNKHVDVSGTQVRFEFKGKSGIKHQVNVSSPKIAKTIKLCSELPGFELFRYIDQTGGTQTVDSSDVNQYLKETTDDEITAKDFRTWGGTVLSAITLKKLGDYDNETSLKQNIRHSCKVVASHLRNTVSVCRAYYIHPTIIKSYAFKKLIPQFSKISTSEISGLGLNEFRVLNLLKNYT